MSRKEKNPQQIFRLDGRTTFFEVMNPAFDIGKVQINFIEYDKAHNNKQTKNIPTYIDIDKFLLLANDILSGKIKALGKQALQKMETAKAKYANYIWFDNGGISAANLAVRGKARSDGMALSRMIKLVPGNKAPWVLSAETGPGKENETGLIMPSGHPEEIVRVPFDSDDRLKRFALLVKVHIEAYYSAQYVKMLKQADFIQTLKSVLEGIKEGKIDFFIGDKVKISYAGKQFQDIIRYPASREHGSTYLVERCPIPFKKSELTLIEPAKDGKKQTIAYFERWMKAVNSNNSNTSKVSNS